MFERGVWHQEFWRHLIWGCRDLQISNLRITTRPVTPVARTVLAEAAKNGRHVKMYSTYRRKSLKYILLVHHIYLLVYCKVNFDHIWSYMCIISIHIKYTMVHICVSFPIFSLAGPRSRSGCFRQWNCQSLQEAGAEVLTCENTLAQKTSMHIYARHCTGICCR